MKTHSSKIANVNVRRANAARLQEQAVKFCNTKIEHPFIFKGMINSFINPDFSCEDVIILNKSFFNLIPCSTIPGFNVTKKQFNLVLQIENNSVSSTGKRTMSFTTATTAIQNLLNDKPDIEQYSIHFEGQEPIKRKNLIINIAEFAYREIVIIRQKKVHFVIHSHTADFAPDVLDFFHDYGFTVMVEYNNIHLSNEDKHSPNYSSAVSSILENIQQLQVINVNTCINITINSQVQNYTKVFDYFENLKIPYIYTFALANSKAECLFNEVAYDAVDRELKKATDFFLSKILSNQQVFCTEFVSKMAMLNLGIIKDHGCEAGRSSITVDTNGNYYTCQYLVSSSKKVGKVDTSINIRLIEKRRSPDVMKLDNCKKCLVRNLCGGGCNTDRCNINGSNRCRLSYIEWKNILYAYSQWIELR